VFDIGSLDAQSRVLEVQALRNVQQPRCAFSPLSDFKILRAQSNVTHTTGRAPLGDDAYNADMARPRKSFAELFLPLENRSSRPRRGGSVDGNPSIQAIWDVVCAIPRGRVLTYGAVARAAGLPGRARLAGFALKIAPKKINLPWHRVVGAGGRIVFPTTSLPYREQAKRLRAEGVELKNGRAGRAFIADLGQI
jgi:methylated-DNA-protein-cysteine methyltransferase-like protein